MQMAENEHEMMTEQEKFALKIECIRAAAAVVLSPENPTIDPAKCADIAWQLYQHLTKMDWERKQP
jgi:hypothetical protein